MTRVRQHDPVALERLAYLHGQTPIEALSSTAVQARAWHIVSQLPTGLPAALAGPDNIGIAAVIGFYSALFDLDPVAVALDVAAAVPHAGVIAQRIARDAGRFICPACGAASSSPEDLREGYCGRCHAFTGKLQPPAEPPSTEPAGDGPAG